jgi:hypothetical protein
MHVHLVASCIKTVLNLTMYVLMNVVILHMMFKAGHFRQAEHTPEEFSSSNRM